MAKPTGFIEFERKGPPSRPVAERVGDWLEYYEEMPAKQLNEQAARCMDCGVPFCHQGCPLGNIIPDWNDLVYRGHWRDAIERLHATNNFPEFTGRLCPAPCEAACVLAINDDPVTIKQVEVRIIERAWEEGWIHPEPPQQRTERRVRARRRAVPVDRLHPVQHCFSHAQQAPAPVAAGIALCGVGLAHAASPPGTRSRGVWGARRPSPEAQGPVRGRGALGVCLTMPAGGSVPHATPWIL